MSQNDRLGRGLGALLGDYVDKNAVFGTTEANQSPPTSIPIRLIAPNPFQPRTEVRPEELTELADSIKANGLLQPIVVRTTVSGQSYEVVAGNRRLLAAKLLKWNEIQVQIHDVDDATLLVLALVENIQREDLGPLEEAKAYTVLKEEFGFTQQKIAESVGKSRSTIANTLRLMMLPASVRRMLDEGSLSSGHGRALLAIEDPSKLAELARAAVDGSWSVRDTEKEVRQILNPTKNRSESKSPLESTGRDTGIIAVEEALSAHLQARVSVLSNKKGRGAISIPFGGPRELERLYSAVTGQDAAELAG